LIIEEKHGVNWGDRWVSTPMAAPKKLNERGIFVSEEELLKAIDEIYRYPLRDWLFNDTLNHSTSRSGIGNQLSELVVCLQDRWPFVTLLEEALKNGHSDYLFSVIWEADLYFIHGSHSKISLESSYNCWKPASEYIDVQVYQKPIPQQRHSTIQIRLSAINLRIVNYAELCIQIRTTGGGSMVPDILVFEWQHILLFLAGIANGFKFPSSEISFADSFQWSFIKILISQY